MRPFWFGVSSFAARRQLASIVRLLILIPILAAFAPAAPAATDTWNGGGGDNNFKTPANWSGVLVPTPGDILAFDGSARFTPNNNFAAGTVFGGITFNATAAGPFTISGNLIDLNGNITDNTAAFTNTIGLNLALQTTPTISVAANGSLTLGGILSNFGAGSFGLNETGAGLLTLSAPNTFTGPVSIGNGATLSISADNNLGAAPGAFTAGDLVLNGGSTLQITSTMTLNANRGISLVGPNPATIQITNLPTIVSNTVTYDGVISDGGTAGSLRKINFGTLVLGGQNTYTGTTIIGNGTINLDFTQAGAPTSNIINSASSLTLGGTNAGLGNLSLAQIVVTGKAGATNSQAFNNTTVTIGAAVIQATSGAGGSATLNLGTITDNAGGTVTFVPPASGNITTTTSVSTTAGILGGWAVIGNLLTGPFGTPAVNIPQGTDWATVDGSNHIVAYTGYSDYAARIGSDTGPIIPAGNLHGNVNGNTNLKFVGTPVATVIVDADNAGTLTDMNTVAINGSVTNTRLQVGAGNTLRLGQYGGVFKQDTTSGQTMYIGNGTTGSTQDVGILTAGPATGGPGQIVVTNNSTSLTSGTLIFETQITDNPAGGAVSFIKTGVGSMKLDGHNTYSGGTYLLEGRVQLTGTETRGVAGTGNPTGFGTGPVYIFPGAQAFPSGVGTGVNIANNFFIAGFGIASENDGAFRLGALTMGSSSNLAVPSTSVITLIGDAEISGAGTATIADQITGNFNLQFGATSTINTHLVLDNINTTAAAPGTVSGLVSTNNWTGNTQINGGTGGNRTNIVDLGASEQIPSGVGYGNLIMNGTGTASGGTTLNLNGFNQSLNGLISNTNGAANVGTIAITNNKASSASLLTLGGNNQTASFGGVIQDGATGGTIALTKIGTGTQTLSGANTYSGDTNINAGAISVTGSLLSTGNVLVNTSATSGGALYGTGSVGNVTLALANGSSKAVINPGATGAGSTGPLAVATLTANAGADLQFDLATPATSDVLNVTAALTLNGAVTISPSGSGASGVYTVINAGSISGTALTLNAPTSTRSTFTFDAASWNPTTNAGATKVIIDVAGGAANLTWTGAADGTTWDVVTTKNWLNTSKVPNVADFYFDGDNVTFNDTAAPNYGVSLGSAVSPGSIVFNNSAGDYVISGSGGINGPTSLVKNGASALTLGTSNSFSGGVTWNAGNLNLNANNALGSGTFTINAGNVGAAALDNTSGQAVSMSLNPPQTWNANITFTGSNPLDLGAGAVSLGNLAAGANRTITVNGSTLTVGGVIADGANGGNGLIKAGTGTLALNGANTFTGTVTINAGTVRVGNFGALGGNTATPIVVANNAQLDIGGITPANVAGGLGALQFNIIGSGPDGSGVLINSSAVAQQNAFQSIKLTGNATVGGTGRFDVRGGIATLDLSGFTLTKVGTNQFSVNGGTITDGNIVVNQGTFSVEAGVNVQTGNNTTLTFNPGTTAQFFQNTGTVTRPFVFNGAGITVNDNTGANNAAAVASNMQLKGDLAFTGPNTSTLTLSGILSESGGTRSISKSGPSTLVLSGLNNYSGSSTITGGALSTPTLTNGGQPSGIGQSSSDASNLILNGGVFQYSGNSPGSTDRQFQLGTAPNSGLDASGSSGAAVSFTATVSISFIGNGSHTLVLTGTNTDLNTLAATIVDGPGGATGLTKSGTGTWLLTSPNTNSGTVTVGNGTLIIGASSPAGGPGPLGGGATPVLLGLATGAAAASILLKGAFAIGRDITVQGNAGTNTVGTFDDTPGSFTGNLLLNNTLTIQAGTSSAGSVTFSTGTISGTGSVNVNGPGTTFLLSANTYTGGTILNGGVTVANNPSSLGDPASQVAINDATLLYTSTFTTARSISTGSDNSIIDVSGTNVVTHTGSLSIGGTFNKGTNSGTFVLAQGAGGVFIGGSANVLGGTLTVSPTTPLTVNNTLTVTNNANLTFQPSSNNSATGRLTHTLGNLVLSGSGPSIGNVDLGNHELLLNNANPATIKGYLASAYDPNGNADWGQRGLTSSLPRANPVSYSVGYAFGGDQSAQDAAVTTHGGAALGMGQTLVRPVLTGDANLDGKVDFFDITQLLGYKYNTGQPASYTDGDLDYNGHVDFFDIVLLLSANYNTGQIFGPSAARAVPSLTHAPHVAAATGVVAAATTIGTPGDGKPDFEYDPATGHLRFRTDGGTFTTTGGTSSFVSSLTISSAGGILIPGGASAVFANGTGATLTANLMSSALTNTPGFADNFDIGIVLPIGLDAATLTADLTVKYQSLNGGALKIADITFIPEPAGLALVGLVAAAGSLARRSSRRRSFRQPPGDG
jgi:autotransporter-associated beta strand protein